MQNPLRWNSFTINQNWKDVVVKFDVTVTTKSLSLNLIPEKQDYRHKLILKLHRDGLSDREISEYLNDGNILTPTAFEYYPKLIWVTRKKLKDREKRRKDYDVQIGRMRYYLKKEVIPYKVFKNDMV